MNLTSASLALFTLLAKDSGNWNGRPMVDCSPAQRGNLTDLKKAGLLTTWKDDGIVWAEFTPAGEKLAESLGHKILVG